MKIINTSKCNYVATHSSGKKVEKNVVSKIRNGDIVKIKVNRFNKKVDTNQLSKVNPNLSTLITKVKKINCDQRGTFQSSLGLVVDIQLDLLIEINKKLYYIASIDVDKIGNN